MISNEMKKKIIEYYNDGGKHSNYQNFPDFVIEEIGINSNIDEEWRGDTARFLFIKENIKFSTGEKIADVGANTGKFCLDLAWLNRESKFHAYELNENYTNFIKLIKKSFNIENIEVYNIPAGIDEIKNFEAYDYMFHMNVLHHAGVDFDKNEISQISEYEKYAIEYLKGLSDKVKVLIFQMGYNWGGDKSKPIIDVNQVKKMIEFQLKIFNNSNWSVETLGIYDSDIRQYKKISLDNLDAELEKINISKSEFYKRPLYILSSNR